jgi:hypothetical protein
VIGVATLDLIRKRVGIRRDYESIFSLGLAFTAYAAAESVHGSGFLAAFAAGLTISLLDVELCDCFLEYGETTAEMTLLFTFVLFGSSLIWSGLAQINGMVLLFALLALLVRPVAFLISLARVRLAIRDRLLIAWFGPRGLSSLLLILLPVFAGIPGTQSLFAICSLVVILSVIVHGSAPMFLLARRKHHNTPPPDTTSYEPVEATRPTRQPIAVPVLPAPEPPEEPAPSERPEVSEPVQLSSSIRISVDELRALWRAKEHVIILDVRKIRPYEASSSQARGAIRLSPERAVEDAQELGLPYDAYLAAYCT